MQLWSALVLAAATEETPITVCAVKEFGFCMPAPGKDLPAQGEVVEDGVDVVGFDVDLRRVVLADIPHVLRLYSSYAEVNVRTRVGECDVGFAPFFATAQREQCRECAPIEPHFLTNGTTRGVVAPFPPALANEQSRCCTDFGSNYVQNGVGLLGRRVKNSRPSSLKMISMVFSSADMVNAACLVIMFVIIAGHIIWLLERTENARMFPKRYLDGMDDGVWWAAVTVTTVGYGDRVPVTWPGRLFGIVWMFTGLFICSIFTSTTTTLFVHFSSQNAAKEVSSLADIPSSQKVCSYATLVETDLSRWPFKAVKAGDFAECLKQLESGAVDQIYMDSPIMGYFLESNETAFELYRLSPPTTMFITAFQYPEDSQVLDAVNSKLLEFYTTDDYKDLSTRWFGDLLKGSASTAQTAAENSLQMSVVLPTVVFIIFYGLLQTYSGLLHPADLFRRLMSSIQPQSKVAPDEEEQELKQSTAPKAAANPRRRVEGIDDKVERLERKIDAVVAALALQVPDCGDQVSPVSPGFPAPTETPA